MKTKINHNGWTVLLIDKDLIVYTNGEQRTYKIKEANDGLEHKEGDEYFYIRTNKGFYYQFKFEIEGGFVGDKYSNDDEFIDTFAVYVFGDV